ncbi:MAG: PQQ-binding-like beta-propeller repeat protein [Burkholderiales bacterium]|nr:PQQ-binding-like beta-propeller repeat protein [Burkholderiales bacterium]
MRKTRLAGLAAVAALALGAARAGAEILPESGPLPKVTMERLLLVDATHRGNRVIAVGDRGYIVLSDDNGKTWRRAKSPPAPLLTAVEFLDASRGWAVGHDSVILATTDGGETWTQQFAAPAEQRPLLDVTFVDANVGYAIGAYGAFYETADGGKTWNERKVIADDKHLNAFVRLPHGRIIILGEAGTILLSRDDGRNWASVPSPYKGSLFGGVVADDGAVIAYGLRGRIFRSTDGGLAWKAVDNPSVATLMGGSKLPDGALVLAGNGGTVLVSRDNGQSFVPLATGSTKAFSRAILGPPNAVILIGETGAREAALPLAKR